jgi:hypothetical protein
VTVCRGESGTSGRVGLMAISGRETTANSPKDMGCSGSEMVEMRSDPGESRLHFSDHSFLQSCALPSLVWALP